MIEKILPTLLFLAVGQHLQINLGLNNNPAALHHDCNGHSGDRATLFQPAAFKVDGGGGVGSANIVTMMRRAAVFITGPDRAGGGIRPQGYVNNPLEWVDPFGLEKKGSASQVQKNTANGKAAEELVLDKLSNNPNVTVLGTRVYVKTLGSERGRYVDILI
ncbi:Hypothetical protein W5S_4445 [Pectobacterium parmentieri]|uniref:Uncharacterized protein n=1 Tax=Pectobacterium parmentieri TaxID=1905730 RepID=A0A0H3IAM2_PECPM|nr:Hypothetical protein W5S_4445 [Pectobacterium parmentieri]